VSLQLAKYVVRHMLSRNAGKILFTASIAGEMGCASDRTCMSARQAELVLSVPAKLAVKFHSALPGITAGILAFANGMLPSAAKSETEAKTGRQSTSTVSSSWITALNERAAENNNQVT